MNPYFVQLMRRMPAIMIWLAIIYYVATVFVGVTVGTELANASDLGLDTLPLMLRIKAFLLLFVQPLLHAMVVLFGAALLWRIDRLLAHRSPENSS